MHTTHATHPPPLFSPVRIISFLTCILVALGSGTNYVGPGWPSVSMIHADTASLQVFSGSYLLIYAKRPGGRGDLFVLLRRALAIGELSKGLSLLM